MTSTSKKWFAVYTYNKAERKVCMLLGKKKIECFYPLNKVVLLQAGKEKVLYKPLLNNYVFVYADDSDQAEIKATEGIKTIMYWVNEPAVIKSDEIDMLKHVLNEHDDLHLEKININLQDQMSVNEFTKQDEQSSELAKRFLRVSFPSIGYALVAEIKAPEGKVINLKPHSQERRAVI